MVIDERWIKSSSAFSKIITGASELRSSLSKGLMVLAGILLFIPALVLLPICIFIIRKTNKEIAQSIAEMRSKQFTKPELMELNELRKVLKWSLSLPFTIEEEDKKKWLIRDVVRQRELFAELELVIEEKWEALRKMLQDFVDNAPKESLSYDEVADIVMEYRKEKRDAQNKGNI